MLQLTGKVAIITGASAGIGLATARVMAQRGAAVVITGTRLANVEPGAAAIRAEGGKADAMQLDLGEESSIVALIDAVVKKQPLWLACNPRTDKATLDKLKAAQ